MSVPTITGVTPAAGLAAGDELVTITGTNFRVTTIPTYPQQTDPSLRTPVYFKETVQVLFDGVSATDVKCFDPTMLTCLAPPHAATAAPVTITVINIDDNGVPIAGESASIASAYSYSLPIHTGDYETEFARAVRTLIRLMKQQLIAEVNFAVQTDYDPTSGDEFHVTKFAKLPGIALVGPELAENRFFSLNDPPTEDDGTFATDGAPAGFIESRVPYTIDATFDVLCATDNKNEFLNLMANFVAFMHKNKFLVMNRSATDPTLGSVRYEMDFVDAGSLPKNTTIPNNSNVLGWTAKIVIRGFDIEAFGGIDAGSSAGVPNQAIVGHGKTVDQLNLDPTSQSSVSSRVGPSPGR